MRQYAGMGGLQPTVLGEALSFKVEYSFCKQEQCLILTVVQMRVICICYSMPTSYFSTKAKEQIAAII